MALVFGSHITPLFVAAALAVRRYDAAIRKRVVDGAVDIIGTGGGVAMGDDLDALYDDMTAKSEAALTLIGEDCVQRATEMLGEEVVPGGA